MSTIKDMIRAAKLPERVVLVCLNLDLQGEFEDAERQLQATQLRPRESLADGGDTAEIAARIEALREQMQASTVPFRLRALTRPAWRALLAAHPPRKDDEGQVDDRDKNIGVDTDTFFEALIRSSVVAPELDEEDWRTLLDERLTDRQFDELANAAWALNRKDVDVPFSFAASRLLRNSSPE